MSQLIDDISDLWNISLDILAFYHECCYNCQPYEEGEPVWLSTGRYVLAEVLEEVITAVCDINSHVLQTEVNFETIEEALREEPFRCPNCGTEHYDAGNEIGGEWLVRQGEETRSATYLLTRTFWPYLTHYTKTDAQFSSGLDRLLAIANSGVIRGTTNMIEGDRPAVCFTECSPLEIMEMLRVMEMSSRELPYGERGFEWRRSKHGIAIERGALVRYGGRPVIHGDSLIIGRLGEDYLWLFKAFDRGVEQADWTFERELRVPDNVLLNRLNPRHIILIVEDRAEQFRLLAQRDVPMYAIIPFDFVYSDEDPYPHLSGRQRAKQAESLT